MQWYTEYGPGREGHKTLEAGEAGGAVALRFMMWFVAGSIGYPKSTRGRKPKDGKMVRGTGTCVFIILAMKALFPLGRQRLVDSV